MEQQAAFSVPPVSRKTASAIALMVGVPSVALGLGYYYYLKRNKNSFTLPPIKLANDYKSQGNSLFKENKYAEAIEAYTLAVQHCPSENSHDLSIFYQNRAAAKEKLGLWYDVVGDCSSSIKLNPKYTKAFLRRAKAYENLSMLEEALTDYTAGCFLEGFRDQKIMMSAESVLRSLSQMKARKLLASRTSDVVLSTSFIDAYLSSFCEDPIMTTSSTGSDESSEAGESETWSKIMDCMLRKEYASISLLCSEEVANEGSEKLRALLLRGTFALLKGNASTAAEDFDALLNQIPDDKPMNDKERRIKSNTYIKRGSLYMQCGNKEAAFNDFSEAIKIDPQNADIYQHRGQLYIMLDEIDDAILDFEKAVQLRPDFSIAVVQQAFGTYRAAAQSGSYLELEKAFRNFENMVEKHDKCSEGYALYGQALAEQMNLEEAGKMFDKAIELSPGTGTCYVHKAIIAQQKDHNYDKCCEIINKALEVDPNCEFAYETLASLEGERGNLEKSTELFDKALGLARTEMEMCHLYSLREGVHVQRRLRDEYGIAMPNVLST